MKRIFAFRACALLLVLLSFCTMFFTGCKNQEEQTTVPPATNLPTEPVETEPPVTEPVEDGEWNGTIDASFFTKFATDFSGEVEGEQFEGILLQNNTANSITYFTKPGVIKIWNYARANGYDALRVHIYVRQKDNGFQIDTQTVKNEQWSTIDIPMANLDSLTVFKSLSTGAMENYLWFEFANLPIINETSFTGGISAFSGTVGGVEFNGFVFRSREYQPATNFQDYAIEDIKAYAKENGYNALRISCYPKQFDNLYLVGGNFFSLEKWKSVDFSVEHITSEFTFWSQSQGVTENYMIFEFVNSNNPVIPSGKTGPKTPTSPYFTSQKGFAVQKYKGTIEDVTFEGFKFTSSTYQPDFFFTAKAINEIRAAAEKSGNNFLRIHSYSILLDNGFIVGGQYTPNGKWSVTDVNIADLSTNFRFWSQSQGTSEIYLWFEMFRLDIPEATSNIDASFFEKGKKGDGSEYILSIKDYAGEVVDTVINGVQIKSSDYQPKFKFSADGISAIKAYAEANDVNFLKIHAYSILFDNNLVIGGTYTKRETWVEVDVAVEDLSEEFVFWSQSQGLSEIYLWFEFFKLDIPDAETPIDGSYFEGINAAISTQTYAGEIGGETINGVLVKSADYQPKFCFTSDAVEKITAYAEEKDYDTLIIHSYAVIGDAYRFVLNGKYTKPNMWNTTEVPVRDLKNGFTFWSTCEQTTSIYFYFGFQKSSTEVNPYGQAIHAGSFESADAAKPVSFADYKGLLNNSGFTGTNEFTGVYVTSSAATPTFKFTAKAVEEIKAYAAENGYTHLKIYANAVLTESTPRFIMDNGGTYQTYVAAAKWYSHSEAMPIDYISENIKFYSQFYNTQVYLKFEFIKETVENPYGQAIHAGSFESVDAAKPVSFADYKGLLNNSGFTGTNEEFTGVYVTSSAATPTFKFTAKAVEEIKAYAAENGYTHLKIYANAVLTESTPRFIMDNGGTYQTYVAAAKWYSHSEAMPIDYISENIKFYSQFYNTQVYLKIEFIKETVENPYGQAIHAGSFESADATKPVSFADYKGLLNNSGFTGTNEEFTGVYVTSSAATPTFKFTAKAVEEIKAYAAENGYTHLKIYANAVLTESTPRFIMDNGGTYQTYVAAAKWYSHSEAMPIDYISENIKFYSQFYNTQVYLKFEFIKETVENPYGQAIHAGSFESADAAKPVSFADYKGLLNNSGFTGTNEEFTGVYVTSSAATPTFKFTAKAVEEIKAYAAENGYTHLKIYANAVLTESTPRFIMDQNGTYQTYVAAAKWYSHSEAMPIDYISENIKFYSQFYNTQIYLKFEFIKETVENPYGQAIHAGSFESADATKPVSFADYKGLLNNSGFTGTNEEFTGVYVTSSAATPYFKFTAKAVEEIKVYAAENGYTHLKIYANAVLTESTPRFIMDQNGTYQTYVAAAKWYSHSEAMPIDYISENIKFYSQFYNTQIYLRFEFLP